MPARHTSVTLATPTMATTTSMTSVTLATPTMATTTSMESVSASANNANTGNTWPSSNLHALRRQYDCWLMANRQARAYLIVQAQYLQTECAYIKQHIEALTHAMEVARPATPPRPRPDQLAVGAPTPKKRMNVKLANKPLERQPEWSTPAESHHTPAADPSPRQPLFPIPAEEGGDQLEPGTPGRDPHQSQHEPASGEKQPKPRTGTNTIHGLPLADTASSTPCGTSRYCLRWWTSYGITGRTLHASMPLIHNLYCARLTI